MTEKDDHPSLKDKYPIDKDYINPTSKRADISTTEEDPKDVDFSAVEQVSSKHTDMSHRFIRDGSGLGGTAWDHEIDMNAPQEHDGRASTRTGFDPRESNDPKKWMRLGAYQDEQWHPDRKQMNSAADQRRFISMFSSRLELTPHQKARAMKIVESINFAHMAHYSTEIVVLSIISLVANEDGRWIRDEATFHALVRDIEATLKDIRSCRQLVRQKSEVLR